MPIRTPTIAVRSRSDRGRSAERTPAGIAIRSQTTAPPKTSEAVTGAASSTISFTLWRLTNERPRSWWTTSRSMYRAYWT
jgi:hypothetical protein